MFLIFTNLLCFIQTVLIEELNDENKDNEALNTGNYNRFEKFGQNKVRYVTKNIQSTSQLYTGSIPFNINPSNNRVRTKITTSQSRVINGVLIEAKEEKTETIGDNIIKIERRYNPETGGIDINTLTSRLNNLYLEGSENHPVKEQKNQNIPSEEILLKKNTDYPITNSPVSSDPHYDLSTFDIMTSVNQNNYISQ